MNTNSLIIRDSVPKDHQKKIRSFFNPLIDLVVFNPETNDLSVVVCVVLLPRARVQALRRPFCGG